jgi:phosphatidylinositol 4-kinase
LALCKAAPLVRDAHSAETLMGQIFPYILEAHSQVFEPSPYFRDVDPSPIEALSYNLTTALLTLGINHPHLRDTISEKVWGYLRQCVDAAKAVSPAPALGSDDGSAAEVDEAVIVTTLTITVLGFLDAAATHANFWTPHDRLLLIQRVKGFLSEEFLVAVETAFSTIRNSHTLYTHSKEWKRYVKHYAAVGRPLGAMILQRSFMWLLVAVSSLLVADVQTLRNNDILNIHMANTNGLNPLQAQEVDFDTVEIMADIASDEMSLLEDGADYLRLGSTWQQRLAFSVKAGALTSYLNCSLLNEDAADVDALMAWLEDTLADPAQMADETLASVVLRSLALIAKLSPGLASNISRLLPRFIVQGSPRGDTIALASNCLAFVLQLLSQDSIITTLYTFGNVLSSTSTAERALGAGSLGDFGADGTVNTNFYSGKQSTGSSISLPTSGEDETSYVYGNVVQAICGIASNCKDAKIIALAQSMLLQKLGKVNKTTDARIIKEAAGLALSGGPLEFRTLLKVYAKVIQDSGATNSDVMLDAVSQAYIGAFPLHKLIVHRFFKLRISCHLLCRKIPLFMIFILRIYSKP